MVNITLGIGSYVRNRGDMPPWGLINRFYEQNPSNQEDQVSLIERPALADFLEAGDGPGRRVFTQPGFASGALFHVSGAELYKHVMNTNRTVTTTQISGLVDGTGSPDIACTRQYLWITDGVDLQYTNGTAALTPIVTPDDKPMISLDVFNEYVLCVQNQSDRIYWIEPGAVVIDPLDFFTAERKPDQILQVRTVGDEFWALGEVTIEPHRATGDGDAPFQRIEGRSFNFGIWGGTAVRTKDTSVICIAHDGSVQEIAGVPNQISNPSVAERTRDAILAAQEAGL